MGTYVRTGVTTGRAREKRSYHPAYRAWQNMVTRCTNPKNPNYQRYGGRGITVCDSWKFSANFLTDMLPTWYPGASLDRKENDGNYDFGNCRWIPLVDNIRKQRKTRFFTWNNELLSIRQIAITEGIQYETLRLRLNTGQSPNEAIGELLEKKRSKTCVF